MAMQIGVKRAPSYRIVPRNPDVPEPRPGIYKARFRTWADAALHLQDVAAARHWVSSRDYDVVTEED